MSKSEAEHSIVGSYTIIKTVTGGSTDTFPTAFPFGASTTGTMNLLLPKYGGAADETRGYRTEILITGKPAGSATIQFTGIAPGGPEEPICSLACTVGATDQLPSRRRQYTENRFRQLPPLQSRLGQCGIPTYKRLRDVTHDNYRYTNLCKSFIGVKL
jgi:hypothetical protein